MSERKDDDATKAVFQVTIQGTVDDIWRELTKTDEAQQAMFNSRMHVSDLAAGGQLRMRSPDGRYTAVAGEILEVRRPVRLAHTMQFTTSEDPPATITYDLEEVDEGVRFKLTVENLQPGTKSAKQMLRGGPFITKTMKQIVEKGRPALGTRLLYRIFGLLSFLNPKRTRSENWPLPDPGLPGGRSS